MQALPAPYEAEPRRHVIPRQSLGTRALALIIALLFLPVACFAQQDVKPAEKKIREIFVPFEDLNVLLEGTNQRVFLTRQEYEDLLAKARLLPAEDKAPRSRVLLSADYEMTIREGHATIEATIVLDVLSEELLGISLPLRGVSLRSATLDGQPAPMGRGKDGLPVLFVRGGGRHELKLDMIALVEVSAAQQMLQFQLVTPTATRWHLTVPGNVELKGGTAVVRRTIDEAAGVTRFELLPHRGTTTLVFSLNNRILMQERVVLARSVLLDELTQSYERLHATVSLTIPHGAVDRFRFALPPGFEVTDVATPLLARWVVEPAAGEKRVLEIVLREPTTETVVVNVVAGNHSPQLADWTLPQLRPLDAANHVSVIGVLVEERLAAESLAPGSLIPIDVTVLQAALPASVLQAEHGAPRIRPVAAFYAPQPDYGLKGVFRRTPPRLEVTSNLLFLLSDEQLQLRGGFALLPKAEKLFSVDIAIPAGWQVMDVTQNDGTKLPHEILAGEMGSARLQVRLPQGAPPGSFFNIFVHARSVPVHDWSQSTVWFPVFAVAGADRDVGAIAVQATDDLVVRPDQLNELTPLDDKEKAEFGLAETTSGLAYRYESQPYSARLTVSREQPHITARTFSFVRLEPEGLMAHYELLYQVEQARTRRLALRLPLSTPAAVSIRGLDVPVKEFYSEIVDGQRRWTAELAESRSGLLRLAVDFLASLPNDEPKGLSLPIVRADGVAYQSGTVAVEGNSEFDLQLTTAARPVDVGELVDAEYQVGKRLIGSYGFVGDGGTFLVDVFRRPEYGLPAAIVQRVELVTLLSPYGVSQTAARYQLRTKAQFLELLLPAGAELWSATVDNRPASPQRERDRLLISLPPAGPDALRDLQFVYETPVAQLQLIGTIQAAAPRLILRDDKGTASREVPMADLQWHLVLPEGHRLVRAGGTVFTDRLATPYIPAGVLAVVDVGETYRDWRKSDGPSAIDSRFREAQAVTAEDSESKPKTEPKPTEALQRESERVQADVAKTWQMQQSASGELASPGDKYWALQGVRSLPIELVRSGDEVTFQSMGVEPRLNATLANQHSFGFAAALLAILVGAIGIAKTAQPLRHKLRYLFAVILVTLAAPALIGLLTDFELSGLFHPAFYVACGLAVWYLLVGGVHGLVSQMRRLGSSPRTSVSTAVRSASSN